ncbi:GTP cyclohydrolase I [Burkholderia theae]|uniref:GTP cyclohydrolase I n=1 Tax=Burkholderia theae TaxID=3143496 RepID=UPI003AFA3094
MHTHLANQFMSLACARRVRAAAIVYEYGSEQALSVIRRAGFHLFPSVGGRINQAFVLAKLQQSVAVTLAANQANDETILQAHREANSLPPEETINASCAIRGGSSVTLPRRHACPHAHVNFSRWVRHRNACGVRAVFSHGTRVRHRIASGVIHRILLDGDLVALRNEAAPGMETVLHSLAVDVDNDCNSREAAKRVAKRLIREVLGARYDAAPTATEFLKVERLDELLIVGPLRVRSACSNNLCSIIGQIWIGVLPSATSILIDLSEYGRLVSSVVTRPQTQEEAVKHIAGLLESRMSPDGLAVVLETGHFCIYRRGTKNEEAKMITSVIRGKFLTDDPLRRRFLTFLSGTN